MGARRRSPARRSAEGCARVHAATPARRGRPCLAVRSRPSGSRGRGDRGGAASQDGHSLLRVGVGDAQQLSGEQDLRKEGEGREVQQGSAIPPPGSTWLRQSAAVCVQVSQPGTQRLGKPCGRKNGGGRVRCLAPRRGSLLALGKLADHQRVCCHCAAPTVAQAQAPAPAQAQAPAQA